MTTEPDLSFLATPEWQAWAAAGFPPLPGTPEYFLQVIAPSPEWQAWAASGFAPLTTEPDWDAINRYLAAISAPAVAPSTTAVAPSTLVSLGPDLGAKAIIQATLERYGLASLAEFAWNQYLQDIPIEQIMLNIRATPEYKARFPAMEGLAKKGLALTEEQYIAWEAGAIAIMRAAGLPKGFYDQPDDFANMLLAGVGLPELQARVELAKTAVFNSDPELLAAFEEFYNIGGRPESLIGDLTAYFLDEKRALPLIQQQFIAAQTSAIAVRTRYGQLSRVEAERLASLGITPEQAMQGFTNLTQMREIFANLPGEAGAPPTREEGLRAVFEGDVEAREAIQRQLGRRRSPFGGGGFTIGQQGITGLG